MGSSRVRLTSRRRIHIHGLFADNSQKGEFEVKSVLIKDTTREEREECVVSPVGSVGASQPAAERSPPETRTRTGRFTLSFIRFVRHIPRQYSFILGRNLSKN